MRIMVSLLVLPPSHQAGQLAPTPHGGNNYEESTMKKKLKSIPIVKIYPTEHIA
jgi:hypothetical protein